MMDWFADCIITTLVLYWFVMVGVIMLCVMAIIKQIVECCCGNDQLLAKQLICFSFVEIVYEKGLTAIRWRRSVIANDIMTEMFT